MIYLNGQPLSITIFPDNTSQCWKIPSDIMPYEGDSVRIRWVFSNESEFLHLAQLKCLLDNFNCYTVLDIAYLPYARQDKYISNSSTFALHPFARLLNSLKFDKIFIMDPHSYTAIDLIHNSEAVYPVDRIYEVYKETNSYLFCYPDKGAFTKYTELLKGFHIFGEKIRDQLTGNIISYKLFGDCTGLNVLIVDDICDGGMTFKLLAKDLLAAGAKEANLFVTHGLFSKGTRTLFESGINRIFTKDGEVSERTGSLQL